MTGRPRVLVTREGLYYLFVVLFIIGGSVLREVNLLVALAGMMIAPLLFNWRVLVRSMRRLRVRRQAPARCEAGRPLRVRVEVANARRGGTCWMLSAVDTIRRDDGSRQRASAEISLPCIRPGTAEAAAYRLVLAERGRYWLGPLRLETRFPFGLMRCRAAEPRQDELIVWPRPGQLTSGWRWLLRGAPFGGQRSQSKRGQDGDFFALRPFSPGDSLRMVHWRSTARVGSPMVRQNEQLELPEFLLVLDPYLPAAADQQDRERLERMLRMSAAVLLDICRDASCHLSVTLAGREVRSWRSAPTRRFAEQLLDELALVEGHDGPLDRAVAEALGTARTPPIVISARGDQRPALLGGLTRSLRGTLERGHWLSVDEAEGEIYLDAAADAAPPSAQRRSAGRAAGPGVREAAGQDAALQRGASHAGH